MRELGKVLMLENPWVLVMWRHWRGWFLFLDLKITLGGESAQPSVKETNKFSPLKLKCWFYSYHFTTEPLSLQTRHHMLTPGSASLPPQGVGCGGAISLSLCYFLPSSSSPAHLLSSFLSKQLSMTPVGTLAPHPKPLSLHSRSRHKPGGALFDF